MVFVPKTHAKTAILYSIITLSDAQGYIQLAPLGATNESCQK